MVLHWFKLAPDEILNPITNSLNGEWRILFSEISIEVLIKVDILARTLICKGVTLIHLYQICIITKEIGCIQFVVERPEMTNENIF